MSERRAHVQERTARGAGPEQGRTTGHAAAWLRGWVARQPAWGMAVGALCVSTSAVLIDLTHASPGTASFYRTLLALPILLVLTLPERRDQGPPPPRQAGIAMVAGALFAGDMMLWTQAIIEVGAGLSTVLVNVQVVLVPLLALAVDREPVTRRYLASLPVLLLGVVLTAGLVNGGAAGTDPVAGTVHAMVAAICYSLFLYLLRRGGHQGHVIQSYTVVTASAALVSLLAGELWHGVHLLPGWATVGWLAAVAVLGQVFGWLLVALTTPRLASEVGAILLLLTPVGAVALGAVVLGERPTLWQLAGCVLILAGAYVASTHRRPSGDVRVRSHHSLEPS